MTAKNRILSLVGNKFRGKVIALKKSGIKTEPAFTQLSELSGNSYENIMKRVE